MAIAKLRGKGLRLCEIERLSRAHLLDHSWCVFRHMMSLVFIGQPIQPIVLLSQNLSLRSTFLFGNITKILSAYPSAQSTAITHTKINIENPINIARIIAPSARLVNPSKKKSLVIVHKSARFKKILIYQ